MVGVRQFDEEETLARALDVFWRKGLRATSLVDIAEATGVQRGSLYNAYGDKEQVFLLAYERVAARFLEAMRAAAEREGPRATLQAVFDVAVSSMTNGSPSRGCLTTKTAADSASLDARVQGKLRIVLDALQALLAKRFARPDMRGALALPPQEAARLVVTFTRGLAIMERVYGDPKRLRASAQAMIRCLLQPRIQSGRQQA